MLEALPPPAHLRRPAPSASRAEKEARPYGCSLHHIRLQPPPHPVAASITSGCSLHHIRLQVWIRAKYEARQMVRRDLSPAQLPAALCAAAREVPQPPGAAGGEGGSQVSPGGLARLLAVICQARGPTPNPVWLTLTSVP